MKGIKSIRQLHKALRILAGCGSKAFWMISFLALLEAVIPLGGAVLSSLFIEGLEKGASFQTLLRAAVIGVVILLVLNILRGKMSRCHSPYTEDDDVRWIFKFREKTMSMDYEQLDSAEAASLRARIENDRNWGCGGYAMIMQFRDLLTGIFGILTAFAVLLPVLLRGGFWRHWSTLLFLLYLAAVICTVAFSEKKSKQKEQALRAEFDLASSRSTWLMNGGITYREGKDIRIYEAQPLIKAALREEAQDKMVDEESRLEARAGALDGAASGLLLGGSYLFIVLRALAGALSSGSVVLFASGIYRFSESMKMLNRSFSEIVLNAERMESSFEYQDLPDRIAGGGKKADAQAGGGEIEFRNVSFRYPGTSEWAVDHVSFILKPGRKAAVVGRNGSGKTTLIKLLCRLYDPTEGTILLNGVDIREYDYEEYLRLFSVVFQDFKLLALPLGENVAAGREYEEDRVRKCLEKAGFTLRLDKMEKGLQTSLYRDMEEDGVEISGGEAQKIALARALYKDAPIVILDEPTAALDPVSEYEIYSGFQHLVGERTSMFISHRLSSCRFCDEIFVLRNGQLIQRGSHEELIKDDKGSYSVMWRAQAQYYDEKTGTV